MITKDIKVTSAQPFSVFIQTPLICGDVDAYRIVYNTSHNLENATFMVTAILENGNSVIDTGSTNGNTAYYVLKNNMYCEPGNVRLRLTVLDDTSILTENEIICIALDGNPNDGIDGDDRLPILSAKIMELNSLNSTAKTLVDEVRIYANALKFKIDNPRLVVGMASANVTAENVDYLCDGENDDVEINAAIQALPPSGGEVVILPGNYDIKSEIMLNKSNVTLSGSGNSTVLCRGWGSAEGSIITTSVIYIDAPNCTIQNLSIDGCKSDFTNSHNCGIYADNECANSTIKNVNSSNNAGCGIYFISAYGNCSFTYNTCNDNDMNGMQVSQSGHNTFEHNTCNNNYPNGIHINGSSSNSEIRGHNIVRYNTCNNNDNGIRLNSGYENNIIEYNFCSHNDSRGIYCSSCGTNSYIKNNICLENKTGLHILSTKFTNVVDNHCNWNTATGMVISSSELIVVGDNTCMENWSEDGSIAKGLHLTNCKRITANSNICNANYTYGINVNNCINSSINGNVCCDNGGDVDVSTDGGSGIHIQGTSYNNSIEGNTCIRGDGTPEDYNEVQDTISVTNTPKNNIIAYNNIMGKNYVDNSGNNNTFIGNKYE